MKIWLCVVSVLCWTNIVCAQAAQEYPDVPASDPAYADINLLASQSGIQDNCFGACYPGPRRMTRYEFAVAIARLCRFPSNLSDHTKNSKAGYETSIQGALSKRNPQERAALARLIVQFFPELQQLGIAREQIEFAQKELAAYRESTSAPIASSPFPDVPKTHWAFSAVESLRQSGIVIGYPDNTSTKQSLAGASGKQAE